MHNIDVLQTIRVAVFVAVCVGLLLCLAVWTGRRLKLERARDESANRIRDLRKARLARLLELAEKYESAPSERERQRLYRQAESLTDDSDARPFVLDYRALVGNVAEEMDKASKPPTQRSA